MTAEERAAELLAARCLVAADVRTLPVDPARLLRLCRGTLLFTPDRARAMGVPAEELAALSPACPAVTFDRTGPEGIRRRIVCYLPETHPARLRRTLAHELGHIVWKHHADGRPIRPAGPRERQADAFARALLAPPCLVRRLRGRVRSVRSLAWVFGLTSAEAERLFVWLTREAGQEEREKDAGIPADLAEEITRRLLPPAEMRLSLCEKDERKSEIADNRSEIE